MALGRRFAIAAASRTARALLSASTTPALRSAASWRSSPCGSSSVPHTEPTKAIERFFFALSRVGIISAAGSGCEP